jgi:hypothetical protein
MKRAALAVLAVLPAPAAPATSRNARTWIRDAPAIRPFAEPDPSLVHWSELERLAKARSQLMSGDVRSYFGRFG